MNSVEADFLSELGLLYRATNWFGKTDRKREIEQEKGVQEPSHVHLQLLVLLV